MLHKKELQTFSQNFSYISYNVINRFIFLLVNVVSVFKKKKRLKYKVILLKTLLPWVFFLGKLSTVTPLS
jgi:c-di-GMP-related signal transduction protein